METRTPTATSLTETQKEKGPFAAPQHVSFVKAGYFAVLSKNGFCATYSTDELKFQGEQHKIMHLATTGIENCLGIYVESSYKDENNKPIIKGMAHLTILCNLNNIIKAMSHIMENDTKIPLTKLGLNFYLFGSTVESFDQFLMDDEGHVLPLYIPTGASIDKQSRIFNEPEKRIETTQLTMNKKSESTLASDDEHSSDEDNEGDSDLNSDESDEGTFVYTAMNLYQCDNALIITQEEQTETETRFHVYKQVYHFDTKPNELKLETYIDEYLTSGPAKLKKLKVDASPIFTTSKEVSEAQNEELQQVEETTIDETNIEQNDKKRKNVY